jgi:hypothetical protein
VFLKLLVTDIDWLIVNPKYTVTQRDLVLYKLMLLFANIKYSIIQSYYYGNLPKEEIL